MRCFAQILCFFALHLVQPLIVYASEIGDGEVCVFEQPVKSGFVPHKAFVVIDSNGVHQLSALAVPRPLSTNEGGTESLVAAIVPRSFLAEHTPVRAAVFLLSDDGTFSATDIRLTNMREMCDAAQQMSKMRSDMEEFGKKLAIMRAEYQNVDRSLNELRDKASTLTNVDEIIELKMKLAKLQNSGQGTTAEQERLRDLVDSGRKLPEPQDAYTRLQLLSMDLAETARMTAMADRLNSRRKEVAQASLNDKLALIREMKSVDTEALGREILSLRAKRKELEGKVRAHQAANSPASAPAGDDEF